MNVSYDYYRIFYYVCRYGSFTRAAQMLSNNQPNITRAMNNLEAQLGVTLFIRSKKGIALTDEGDRLFQRVKLAYEQLTLGEHEIEAYKNLENGMVTVGVSEIALHEVLLPVLAQFKNKYPGIVIKVTNESSPCAIKSLQNEMVDFCIVTTPLLNTDNCSFHVLREFSEYAIVRKDLLKGGTKMSLKELSKYPLVMLSEGTGTRSFYEKVFAENSIFLNPQMIAATADQIYPMIKAGLGIGFLPENMIVKDDNVVKIDIDNKCFKRKVVLVLKDNRKLSNAAIKMIEEIKDITC